MAEKVEKVAEKTEEAASAVSGIKSKLRQAAEYLGLTQKKGGDAPDGKKLNAAEYLGVFQLPKAPVPPEEKNDNLVKLVLMRSGEHQFSQDGRVIGWMESGLTWKGRKRIVKAAQLMKEQGIDIEAIHTSHLSRGYETAELIQKELGLKDKVEIQRSWKLNERHYGVAGGINFAGHQDKYTNEQI